MRTSVRSKSRDRETDEPGKPISRSIEQLSKDLARIVGLRLRPPRAGESDAMSAGKQCSVAPALRAMLPAEFFQWYKCPTHGTWLQPELLPFPHWHCWKATPHYKEGHTQPEGYNLCNFKRAAKMRTQIERRIFAVARFLQEHA